MVLKRELHGQPLKAGKELEVYNEAPTAGASESRSFRIDSDTVVVSVQATAVSGTLDIEVFTETPGGQDLKIIDFPTISAPTTNLLLRKAATSMAPVRIDVTYTGACTFVIRARASDLGEASFKISGATSGDNFSTSISGTASLIVPISLEDRNGLSIVNNSVAGILYVGFTSSVTVAAGPNAGTPVKPGGSFGLDIAAGLTLYGISDSGSLDIRILEVG